MWALTLSPLSLILTTTQITTSLLVLKMEKCICIVVMEQEIIQQILPLDYPLSPSVPNPDLLYQTSTQTVMLMSLWGIPLGQRTWPTEMERATLPLHLLAMLTHTPLQLLSLQTLTAMATWTCYLVPT